MYLSECHIDYWRNTVCLRVYGELIFLDEFYYLAHYTYNRVRKLVLTETTLDHSRTSECVSLLKKILMEVMIGSKKLYTVSLMIDLSIRLKTSRLSLSFKDVIRSDTSFLAAGSGAG